jgi:septum formation protein
MLSGKTHQVLTAFALVTSEGSVSKTVSTDVLFRELSEPEIEQYWNTGEPQDKAGSYAIQGIGGKFVKSISGSVSNVVGLPLVELEQELKNMGAL